VSRQEVLAASVCMMLAVGIPVSAAADAPPAPGPASSGVRLLEVPYVPQSTALCGGAAVAMVLRYWGDGRAQAGDFAPQLAPGGAGIRADSLVAAVRARGWTALPVTGTADGVRAQLAQGRPVIALIQVGRDAFHYVVILAWANGGVILHDPATAPWRTRPERAFDEAWSASGRWALLVLPPPPAALSAGADSIAADADTLARVALTGCDAIVADAIARAQRGDTTGAEQRLLSAAALCPDAAAPLRGLAGLRFAAEDWAGAARYAERALALDPDDRYTWRLLAGSRFLASDEVGALRAWNRVAEPRADLARVDGLERIRYRAVSGQLAIPSGSLLTAGQFVRARRRLAEIPAQAGAQLRLKPLPAGSAQVNAAVLERPLVFDGPIDAGGTGVRALAEREFVLRVASPTGNGELWTAGYRWRQGRPRASLVLAIPASGGHPGIWHVAGSWERQSYASAAGLLGEERRSSALGFSDWIGPDVRLETTAALDKWTGPGAYLSLGGNLDVLLADDRLALALQAAGWTSLAGAVPFNSASLGARWTTRQFEQGGWIARASVSNASANAPLALWPGAGTGTGRGLLLRAHPLLADGVIAGRAFGRTLVSAGLERQAWLYSLQSLRFGMALFVDTARAWDTLQSSPTPWLLDGGASLRIAGPGTRGEIRVTAAHGLQDGATAVSVGWAVP